MAKPTRTAHRTATADGKHARERPGEWQNTTRSGSRSRAAQLRQLEGEQLLMTIDEAAASLRICRSTCQTLIRKGELRSILIGRLRRISVQALEDYVARLSGSADASHDVA